VISILILSFVSIGLVLICIYQNHELQKLKNEKKDLEEAAKAIMKNSVLECDDGALQRAIRDGWGPETLEEYIDHWC